MFSDSLLPTLTLADIFGAELVMSPRPSPNAGTWLPRDAAALALLTGGAMAVLGDMLVLCSASVSTPEGMRLLHDAGFQVPETIHRFQGSSDYLQVLSELTGRGHTIVVQHVHPEADLAAASCWIDPAILSFLNNKKNLKHLVDASHLPNRCIMPTEQLRSGISVSDLPLVLKAVTDDSTGGGYDVLVCCGAEELHAAPAYFRNCLEVVVEKFITINRDMCLNYVVSKTGIVTYLGCAEQLVDSHGSYYGNIIDCVNQAPVAAVSAGYQVARRGADHGYWGVVGVDMAILADNQILVYDLNFRLNGSTPALLLAESVWAKHGSRVICYQTLKGRSSYRDLLDAAYTAMERGILLPLSSCHPEFLQDSSRSPLLGCLVLGLSHEQVNEHLRILAELGLESRPV